MLRANWCWPLLVVLVLLSLGLHTRAEDFTPEVKQTIHDSPISWQIYFDDSSTVLIIKSKSVERSTDDGATWTKVPEMAGFEIEEMIVDPNVKERAIAFTTGATHFVTNDVGKSWSKFTVKPPKSSETWSVGNVNFHREDKNLAIIKLEVCTGGIFLWLCKPHHFYTRDGFKSDPKALVEDAEACKFAFSEKDFDSDIAKETIYCSRNTVNSFGHTTKSELLVSSDFFKTETKLENELFKSGKIINIRTVSAFILVLVQKDRFSQKSEVSILTSRDGKSFESSDFDVLMEYGAIVFLDSSPESIHLSVMQPKTFSIGESTMFSSDSHGLQFKPALEHMEPYSITKSQYVDGVWFANILGESNSMMGSPFSKEWIYYTSKISMDDGKTWDLMEVVDDEKCNVNDGCSLQIWSIADVANNDKYVTGPTANIMLAAGYAGKGRVSLPKSSTFISRDGGVTWKMAISEPVIYTFADQGNIIVAVGSKSHPYESGLTDIVYYSLDQGESFQTLKLDAPLQPQLIITTLDGSSSKAILFGNQDNGKDVSYSLNFEKAFGGAVCGEDSFEVVNARVPSGSSEPICVMGHKESFRRRKQDAKCLVKKLFEDVKVQEDPCECSAEDFECTKYFDLSEKNACVPNQQKIAEYCKTQKSKKVKLAHQQLKSGNLCAFNKKKESDFVAETEFECDNLDAPLDGSTNSSQIMSGLSEIEGSLLQYSYVETGDKNADNILVNTDKHNAYASNDGGKTFVKIPIGEKTRYFAVGTVPGTVALCSEENIYYSTDGGYFFTKYEAPGAPPQSGNAITFHPKDKMKFIYYTGEGCGSFSGSRCQLYYTTDGGNSFEELLKDTGRCAFVNETLGISSELIYCAVASGSKRKLVSSSNYFKESKVLFESIVDFALRSKFVFVASVNDDQKELIAQITSDGENFSTAFFPSDFKVEAQTGYTILESESQSIFLHVTTNKKSGQEVGTILKSNSNGTYYITALPDVNRNSQGYTDFDRVDIIEGVLLANVVLNPNQVGSKRLQTKISYNEGSEWHYLAPPAVDFEGRKYDCIGSPLSRCALHLQGFTERPDYRDTFSSTSAIGYLIGVGNVGEYLDFSNLSTFLSTDGGITWREIRKGSYMWEFGDRGTILTLVNAVDPTKEILYSTDNGDTWSTYEFTDEPVQIWDLATVPTDTARKFVIFAGEKGSLKLNTKIFYIDFTHFYSRQCQLDLDNPSEDDFEYWTPKHPESSDNCLFGRETKYLRRANGHNDCFIGASPLEEGSVVVRNCTCTRRDYECDFNFYADNDGTCKLVHGHAAEDRMQKMCLVNGTFQYFEPTGYRKIPSSTCSGGKMLDSWDPRPCPGHQQEFNEFYGKNMSWGKFLLLLVIPSAVFVFAVWFVYEKGVRRNGGFLRLGQIRLDDDDEFLPIEENSVDVVVNRIVRSGIVVVAGTIAVFKTLRKVDRKVMEEIMRVVFGRRPGRRSYVRVPEEEDELFGNFEDNYEEEIGDDADFDFDVQLDPEIFEEFTDQEPNADSQLFDIADEESRGDEEEPVK
ncbi:hypothetical protein PUMCH_001371 [Australozyma saopauloensis]|uniref:VPS10 domain-containing protein n=1 Tax=Australozyma saopauloensis TaxID=291208 RepID=A0AAX4H790_9ASCO|nr:hypothetical protein PUMCH_001371 [[Candida] saopauloensis]